MAYKISWDSPQGVVKRYFDQVTGAEVLAANTKVESDSRFDHLRYVINDFLGCTGLTVSLPEIEEIAAIDYSAALINPNIRIAMVATLPEVVAAANAYANDPLTTYTARVFTTMAEARTWLGLPPA
ncbi:MAG: hypothetical protein H6R16_3338 [Proteobacteria bacterium]|nr:hypothetical protein [Pseudomonadota bacterium]